MFRVLVLLPFLLELQASGQEADDWERVRAIAEAQHNIVMLLIKNNEFDKVLPATERIFSLNFPKEHEHLLAEEAKILSDAVLQHDQTELAHQILDKALKVVRSPKLRAGLHMEKGYICVKEGNDGLAMEHFKKALELEAPDP